MTPPSKILGIDPGNRESGCVLVCDRSIQGSAVLPNENTLDWLAIHMPDLLAIEWIQSMGMAVGKEVFETCLFVGRLVERAISLGIPVRLIPRGAIKLHHCGSSRAKDGNVCQSLRDKYGDKGTKSAPGYFYGVSSHAWQAFAVAAFTMEGAEHDGETRFDPVAGNDQTEKRP